MCAGPSEPCVYDLSCIISGGLGCSAGGPGDHRGRVQEEVCPEWQDYGIHPGQGRESRGHPAPGGQGGGPGALWGNWRLFGACPGGAPQWWPRCRFFALCGQGLQASTPAGD